MNKTLKVLHLFLLCLLAIACVESKSSEKGNTIGNAELTLTDTLKFTSGIRAIFQDSKGNYWFGSHQEGVALFDGKSFRYFSIEDGLADKQVRSIQEDSMGSIWFGTANGVSSYAKGVITTHTESPGDWKLSDNALWFNAGNREGVVQYDGQELKYLAFPESDGINPNNTYAITGIAEGNKNTLWFATYSGVIGYNGEKSSLIIRETAKLPANKAPLHVRSILEDSQGRLWIGNNGIGVLLMTQDSVINFSEAHRLIHPASSGRGAKSPMGTLEHVFVITEDDAGNIWFADRDTGPWSFDGDTVINYTIDAKLSNPMIWSIYQDQQQNLLFGKADGSVFRFNEGDFERVF